MYTLLATPNMIKWLDKNMKQFEEFNPNKYVTKCYIGKTKEGGTFNINLFTTNTITISGSLKKRIYEQLFKQCGEENFIGCDEVGVGDFFGPVVYVSVSFDKDIIELLSKLNLQIRDSKKLDDQEIIDIYKQVVDIVPFSSQICFDSQIDDNLNSIGQKVYFHHQNVLNQKKRIIIDLFTTENSFYKYSKELNITWPNDIILKTKADSIYMTVALASIIARALFLIEMDKLNKKYQIIFPLGAGNVLPTARKFVDLYSKEELATFCKTSFKTFNEI